MPKIKIVQSSWTHGQISDKMSARSDIQNMLTSSASTLDNFVIMQQGGITKRPGTIYSNAIAPLNSRLIPFKNGFGNFIIILETTGLTIFNIDTSTSLPRISFGSAYPDVNAIRFAQNDLQIVFTYNTVPPVSLVMTSSTIATLSTMTFSPAPVYDYNMVNYDSLWFVLQKTTGTEQFTVGDPILITAYSTQAQAKANTQTVAGGAIQFSQEVLSAYIGGMYSGGGSVFGITGEGNDGPGKVSTFIGTLWENDLLDQLKDKVIISGSSSFLAEMTMSAKHGYPTAVSFYQGRLWFGGFRDVPNLIVASKIDKYMFFESGTSKDIDPLNFKLSSDITCRILHILSSKTMVIFTDVGEFAFLSSSGSGTITGSNVNITLQTKNGSTNCRPQELDDQLFYVQAGGAVIRGTDYSYTSNSYQSTNVSILTPEIINNPVSSCIIKNLDSNDNSFLLYINTNGSISCLQSVQVQNISGWTTWTSIGRKFKSACSVDNRCFCIVNNDALNINTIEEFSFNSYVDCRLPVSVNNGISSTLPLSINNLSILLTNGYLYQQNNTIPTNQVNVNNNGINGTGICGVTISSTMKTSSYSLRSNDVGDILFMPKKLTDIYVYYYKSVGINITVGDITSPIPLLKYDSSLYNQEVTPITDIYKADAVIDWSLLTAIIITQSVPYPCTILSIGTTLTI